MEYVLIIIIHVHMYAIVPVVQYPSLVGGGVWVAGSRNFLKVERRYNYS